MASIGDPIVGLMPDPECRRETGMLDLPESCIYAIFSLTMPRDIGRLAVVCKLFKSVCYSDDLWNKFLPEECLQLLSRADAPVPGSKGELCARLGDSILIDGGTKRAWLEGSPAKLGYMLSARALTIIWGDDERYWRFVPGDGHDSRFEVLAELSLVWWLEVRGQIDCRLLSPDTNYRVVFVLKFTERGWIQHGWTRPITFSITTPDGEQMELEERLSERRGQNQGLNNGWMEVVVGEFRTRPAAYGGDVSRIEFYMKEVSCRTARGGLLVDGVRIEPMQT